MPIKQLAEKYLNNASNEKLFIMPNIPGKKLNNAIKSYAKGVSASEVAILIDDTTWGGAKEGLLLTNSAVYAKELGSDPVKFHLQDIDDISSEKMDIYINGKKFFKSYMSDIDTIVPMVYLINDLITHVKDNTSGSNPHTEPIHTEQSVQTEQPKQVEQSIQADSYDNTEILRVQRSGFIEEIKEIKSKYNVSGDFLLGKEISLKQKDNFSTKCNISPKEIIAFIDGTAFKSGKAGLAFCESRLVWKNAFMKSVSIDYANLDDTGMVIKWNDLIINGNTLQLNNWDIKLKDLKSIIMLIAESYKNCYGKSPLEYQKEKELLNRLPVFENNYFYDFHKRLMPGQKANAVLNHAENIFDILFAVSVEQENDAHRRNAFTENASEKLFIKTVYDFMNLALCFPTAINKDKKFNKKFVDILFKNESLSFELLLFVFARLQHILMPYFKNNEFESWIGLFVEKIIFSYAIYKSKNLQSQEKTFATLFKDCEQEIRDDKIMQIFTSRLEEYLYRRNDAPWDILFPHLIESILGSHMKDEDIDSFMDIFGEKMFLSLPEYIELVDKYIEEIFYPYIDSVR